MSTTGIIFSNLYDNRIPELTRTRTTASIPFGCRYRLIDFAISNMANAGITDISVITHYNYQSLMDHIGSGKDWDLARRRGGIKIFPPYITAFADKTRDPYASRLESLKSISNKIYDMRSDNVVLSDCDGICNLDISDMIRQHESTGADITIAVQNMTVPPEAAANSVIVNSNSNGRITGVLVRPQRLIGNVDVNLNVWVVSRRYLQSVLHDAISKGFSSFSLDVLNKRADNDYYRIYRHEGYFKTILSLADYYESSMNLISDEVSRSELFAVPGRPILTKVRNSPPASYRKNSRVRGSLIADGCVIEGVVENSILFRGVKVCADTVVRNSILFQDTYVGSGVSLNCVITDKNVVIRDGKQLSGDPMMPFFIEKGKML